MLQVAVCELQVGGKVYRGTAPAFSQCAPHVSEWACHWLVTIRAKAQLLSGHQPEYA